MWLFVLVGLGALVAQAVKVIIESVSEGRFAINAFFLPGGQPSSHSAAATTLLCALAHIDGLGGTSTAAAATLWGYMLYDAAVTRWQLGLHARRINKIMASDVEIGTDSPGNVADTLPLVGSSALSTELLPDRMGHTAAEVMGGVIVGVLWSMLLIAVGQIRAPHAL